MATQPPPANLPLFYKNLIPLQSTIHAKFKSRATDKAPYLATANAIPLHDRGIHAGRRAIIRSSFRPARRRCRWR